MTRQSSARSLVEVWEDTVSIRDLAIALLLTVPLTLGGYLVAPDEPPMPLVAGLSGAVLGFLICAVVLKPKRVVEIQAVDDVTEGTAASAGGDL